MAMVFAATCFAGTTLGDASGSQLGCPPSRHGRWAQGSRGVGACWAGRWGEPARPPRIAGSDVLAAVDVQLRTIYITRLFGAQEVDGLGDFLGLAQASQRDLLVHDAFGPRRQDCGVDLAG